MAKGIPYMGSKRRLAGDIISTVKKRHPKAKYFYDLFGGGGSVSFKCLETEGFEKVLYNDINSSIIKLLKNIKTKSPTEFYRWVDKETFNEKRFEDDWYSGFIKTIWSFGNNQRSYMYGRDTKVYKEAYHKVIFDNDERQINLMNRYIEKTLLDKYSVSKNVSLEIPKAKSFKDRIKEMSYQIIEIEKDIDCSGGLGSLRRLEHFSNIETLLKLREPLKDKRLVLSNKDYKKVKIDTPVDETVIYLDPPYEGTFEYEYKINHEDMFEWIKNNPYPVYVSGYEAPEYLKKVKSFNHISRVSYKHKRPVKENLFCN